VPADSEELPFIINSNVPWTHPRPPRCNIAYALSRWLTQAFDKWPEHFRKKTQGGPVLAAEQITTALFQAQSQGGLLARFRQGAPPRVAFRTLAETRRRGSRGMSRPLDGAPSDF